MQDQSNPTNFAQERNCSNCAFAIEARMDPSALVKQTCCAWGPPQMLQSFTPQGVTLTVMHPPVNASMVCHQHRLKTEIANAKNSEEKGPAN